MLSFRKQSSQFFLIAMLLLGSLTVHAQQITLKTSGGSKSLLTDVSPVQSANNLEALRKQYPLLMKHPKLPQLQSGQGIISVHNHPTRFSVPMKAPVPGAKALAPLWANLILENTWTSAYDTHYAYVNVDETNGNYSRMADMPTMVANGGVAIYGDTLYAFNADYTMLSQNYLFLNLYKYNIYTWEQIGTPQAVDQFSLIALETAQAPDGTVYGEFYGKNFQDFEWGVIDYHNLTRTTIGKASQEYVALGVSSDNVLYGVGEDGYLYTIDKTNGTETKVGYTGVSDITDQFGELYYQGGEIDTRTDTFYWIGVNAQNLQSTLYTVDLKTGKATKIGDVPNGAMLTGVVIPPLRAVDDAPGEATNLSAVFPDGSNSGNVIFTAPDKTYAGDPLSGELTYSVKLNGEEVSHGTTTAGAVTTAKVDYAAEGVDHFYVTTSNDKGESPKVLTSTFVGFDTPLPPTNVRLSTSKNGDVDITWNAPAEGLHKGYIGNLKYNVYQIQNGDTTEIAHAVSSKSYSTKFPSGLSSRYVYAVEAVNNGKVSGKAFSDGVLSGAAYQIPYYNTLDDVTDFASLLTQDANNDQNTWEYSNHSAVYFNNGINAGDDWLFTPPIHLQRGKNYTLSFKVWDEHYDLSEKIAVSYGEGASASDMTYQLMEPSIVNSTSPFAKTIIVTPPADGDYNFGFHALSTIDGVQLNLDDISLEPKAGNAAPAAVDGLEITPDENGATRSVVSFGAPTVTADNKTLDSIDSIVVKNGNYVVTTILNAVPGRQYQIEDKNPSCGMNTYSVLAYNDAGAGNVARVSGYVGLDVPQAPQNIKAVDNSSNIQLSWDAIIGRGSHNGVVIPEDVTTDVYNVSEDGYRDAKPTWSVTNGTSVQLDINTNEGKQMLRQFELANRNEAGSSDLRVVGIPVGKPSALPFKESADTVLAQGWWTEQYGGTSYSNRWTHTTSYSSDNDGGSFLYMSTVGGGYASLNTFKINLGGVSNPQLIFSDNSQQGGGTIYIYVQTPDGNVNSVWSHELPDVQPWTQHKVSLAAYTNQPWVIVKFIAAPAAASFMGLDDITIQNLLANDLEASVKVPQTVVAKGKSFPVTITVNNIGEETASNYTVSLYKDNKLVADTLIAEELPYFTKKQLTFDVPTSSADGSNAVVKAVITYDKDLDQTNNEVTANIRLDNSDYPGPASVTETGSGSISWTAPKTYSKTVTDDFESYEPFVSPFGDWTTIDGNPEATGYNFYGQYSYPDFGKPVTFMVFNAAKIGLLNAMYGDHFLGHNGSAQAAAVPYERVGRTYVDGDNYLVSPQLSGEAQTISFYVHNILIGEPDDNDATDYTEKFEVLTSTSGNSKDDFTDTILEPTVVSGGDWQLITLSVPAGTRYFAIHQISESEHAGHMLFSVDDVTYSRGSGKPVSYNIYRDGELVGNVSANGTLHFDDTSSDTAAHSYSVSAVYANGEESAPVDAVTTTSIDSIIANGQPFDVYTADGKLVRQQVRTTNGLRPGLYVIEGRKVIVK